MLSRLGVVSHQVVGVPDVQGWSQVQVVVPFDKGEYTRKGGLVIVMSLLGISDEIATRGGQLLQTIVSDFERTREKPMDWLRKNVVWFGNQVGSGGNLSAMIVVPTSTGSKRALYVGGWGEILVQVERGNNRVTVLSQVQEEGKIVSGWIQDGDVVTAGTGHFMEKIWGGLGGDVLSRVEEAQGRVGSLDLAGLMAGVVLEVRSPILQDEEDEKEESVVPPAPVENRRMIPVVEVVDETAIIETPVSLPVVESRPEVEEETYVPPVTKIDMRPKSWKQKLVQNKFIKHFSGKMPELHLRGGNTEQKPIKKISLVLGVLFLSLLLISIVVGSVQRNRAKELASYSDVVSPLQHSLDEASALQTVNPVLARGLVMDVRTSAATLGTRFNNTRFSGDWKKFLSNVDNVWKSVSGEKPVEGKMWLDLGIIRDGTKIGSLSVLDNKKMVVLDKNAGVVLSVNLADKNGWIAGGGSDLSGAQAVSGWPDKGLVLANKGIIQVDTVTKTTTTLLTANDEKWEQPSNLFGFGTSLYILDKQDIWKYPGVNGSLGKRVRWLKPGVQPDFSGTTDWSIDGQIWTLQAGKLTQFDQGKATNFTLKNGMTDSNYTKLAISAKRKEIYLLDPGKSRVVVFDHSSGEYKAQLTWSGFGQASDLVVDDDRSRLLVGKEAGLYEVKLD